MGSRAPRNGPGCRTAVPLLVVLSAMGWAPTTHAQCGGSLRCVADMRREPLEIFKWGRILLKPDNRDMYERIEDQEATAIMKECRRAEECSIREYQEYQAKRAGELVTMQQISYGRRAAQEDGDGQGQRRRTADERVGAWPSQQSRRGAVDVGEGSPRTGAEERMADAVRQPKQGLPVRLGKRPEAVLANGPPSM